MVIRIWRTLPVVATTMVLLLASLNQAQAQAKPADAAAPGQRIIKSGTVASVAGPAENFTGRVRVDPLTATNESINTSTAYVTFEPGARSAWHTHPAGQYLVVTAGAGLTQEWGKPVQELRAGDVVWCPPGVKHWHGAAPTTALTHIAVTGNQAGKSVQWQEKVTDEQYQSR
jgi:quercetin dioxygenase-like cupin family protein